MASSIQQEIPGVVCLDSKPPVKFCNKAESANCTDKENLFPKFIQVTYPSLRIVYPEVWPHSTHGRLFMVCNDEQFQGSGIVIGNRLS